MTTQALGEEGGGPVTTQALGEEGGPGGGGWYTTRALGEEAAGTPVWRRPRRYYRYTTYALGEEGSYRPRPRVYYYDGPRN